jgi:hypothetical protein
VREREGEEEVRRGAEGTQRAQREEDFEREDREGFVWTDLVDQVMIGFM